MQQNEDQKLSRVSTFGSTKSSDGVTTDELKSALGAEWVEIANRIDQELSRSPTLEEQFNSTDNTILRPGSFYELDRKTLQGPDQWGEYVESTQNQQKRGIQG
ncbi:hypothetical protein I204_02189 [Kwoniella mangroviensis CBS 8886]|uniref:hypothetical protein n=1 Tax=Kwoniella mangroviensis CBS 8507 TaxID=1296122 RepID=UPI00080D2576|nr:uncharacterized protein I203_02444 [Kwoniella mangroviensis CBS 8507]OCF69048.1 hypothetical protein I203_02444 [Kwoniella mangroviensis CBS 8507]OCF76493.1 hypothetical protein I204_02189 [Kwoniella mangroviensis CBS 8886]